VFEYAQRRPASVLEIDIPAGADVGRFVAVEKLVPLGLHGARISGVLLMVAGFWMVVR
jgi:hypothetical protein